MSTLNIGLIGCGALGSVIAEGIADVLAKDYTLAGVTDANPAAAAALAKQHACVACRDIPELLRLGPDYVIEAAVGEVLLQHGEEILRSGANLIVLSTGAFADDAFYRRMMDTAQACGRRIHIASGAIGGFDLMRAAMLMERCASGITNRKAPASLEGAPYLGGRSLPRDREEVILDGTAREAIAGFPRNVNVAVATALVTNGMDDTSVRIESVPGMETNLHTIELRGETLQAKLEIASKPNPANPKSSTLAAWSVVALLQNLVSPVMFG